MIQQGCWVKRLRNERVCSQFVGWESNGYEDTYRKANIRLEDTQSQFQCSKELILVGQDYTAF